MCASAVINAISTDIRKNTLDVFREDLPDIRGEYAGDLLVPASAL